MISKKCGQICSSVIKIVSILVICAITIYFEYSPKKCTVGQIINEDDPCDCEYETVDVGLNKFCKLKITKSDCLKDSKVYDSATNSCKACGHNYEPDANGETCICASPNVEFDDQSGGKICVSNPVDHCAQQSKLYDSTEGMCKSCEDQFTFRATPTPECVCADPNVVLMESGGKICVSNPIDHCAQQSKLYDSSEGMCKSCEGQTTFSATPTPQCVCASPNQYVSVSGIEICVADPKAHCASIMQKLVVTSTTKTCEPCRDGFVFSRSEQDCICPSQQFVMSGSKRKCVENSNAYCKKLQKVFNGETEQCDTCPADNPFDAATGKCTENPTTTPNVEVESKSLTTGAIFGIVIGCLAAVLIFGIVAYKISSKNNDSSLFANDEIDPSFNVDNMNSTNKMTTQKNQYAEI